MSDRRQRENFRKTLAITAVCLTVVYGGLYLLAESAYTQPSTQGQQP